MNNIIDPNTGYSQSIFSIEGKNLLKQYVKLYQKGGASSAEGKEEIEQIYHDYDDYDDYDGQPIIETKMDSDGNIETKTNDN